MKRWLERILNRVGPDVYSVSFYEPVSAYPARRVMRGERTYDYPAFSNPNAPRIRDDLEAQLRAWLVDHDPGAEVWHREFSVEPGDPVKIKLTAYIKCEGSAFKHAVQ